MKKVSIIFLFFCLFFQSQVKDGFSIPKNPKIGLSLSGGGAKGFAHVGVLKVLDSLGVKIDYISGTSMGAIVGGLYASGYTGKDIEKIVLETDFYTLIANEKTRQETTFFNKSVDKYILTVPLKKGKIHLPKAISSGQKNIYLLKELFRNVSNINDFSKLPIPFMCVTTNLESGKMEILEKGDLPQAIMASSAFPSLMDPVKIGDSLYIDGAITMNYPSKPLKDKGIDIVIGVDLSQGLAKREDLTSIISILNQVIDFGIQKETKNQYKYTDINIKPNLEGVGATSYDAKKAILDSGFVESKKYENILAQLPKREFNSLRAPINPIYTNVYKIDSLHVMNNNIYTENYIEGKMLLKTPSMQTYTSINKMIDKLYATNNYKIINYDIVQNEGKNILKLDVTEDDTRFFLKFGLHYDEIFKTGLLTNITIKRLLLKNSTLSVDAVIGDKPRYYINYFIDNGYIPGIGFYASGMSFDLKNENSNITQKWTWFRSEAFIQSIWRDRFAIGGGISHDYYDIENVFENKFYYGHFFNPYAFLKSDTQDDKYFPTKGIHMNLEAKAFDIINSKSDQKALQLKADIRGSFRINNWLTYRLTTFYGITLNDVDPIYHYHLGGIFEQNLGNFIRFQGYQLGQEKEKNLVAVANSLQFRLYKNYFIIPSISLANLFNDFKDPNFLKINHSSAGLTLGYKSPFGQIKLNYSHALNESKGILSVILGHWF